MGQQVSFQWKFSQNSLPALLPCLLCLARSFVHYECDRDAIILHECCHSDAAVVGWQIVFNITHVQV